MKKRLSYLILGFIICIIIFLFLGPYLRTLQHENITQITATITTYNCGDGNCIGFIAQKIKPINYSHYQGKLLAPYSSIKNKDELQNQWANLLGPSKKSICLEGNLHKYPIGIMRLFHSGQEGYRIKLKKFHEGSCKEASP